ncbi:MAG: T9SS type A sorting domain-containing protein [Flavobacteriales bacterium]|nr:T9SS type A sorting domain-containing protein [Flavobacteriales bacterium]
MGKFISLLIFVACVQFVQATTYNSVSSGDWGAPATWNPVGPPGCGDTIVIKAGHTIDITTQQDYSACPTPMFVIINGTLDFPVNGPKLRLPCNSGVIINAGGLLTATGSGGGGSANFLEICGTVEWKKADGPVSGPMVFGTPLPIRLLSFEAHSIDARVDVQWITETEINNDYFTLEKSRDGKSWETVSIQAGAGNSSQLISYFDVDYEPIEGLSYYRLKQTDFDGNFTYSNTVPVKFVKDQTGLINVFPNPVSSGEDLMVDVSQINGQEVLVVLRDIKGAEYFSKMILNVSENTLIGVPIDDRLPAGIYLITASSDNQVYSQRVLIK